MKKLFYFNFSIFRSGGARRHSPLCSLIIALSLVLSITLYPVSPARANALQQIQPVYDTTVTQLYDMVSRRMTPAQEDVFNLMLGTYAVGYGGFAQYQLSDPYANESDVISWLKSCGIELYNTILNFGGIGEDPITGVDMRPVIKSLVEVAYGVGIKAQSYTGDDPESDFLSDVASSTNFYIPYNLDINSAINSVMGYSGGFYDWQLNSIVLDPSLLSSSLTYSSASMSNSLSATYDSLRLELSPPLVRLNHSASSNYFNCLCSSSFFSVYHNVFADLTSNTCYLCDDLGNQAPYEFIYTYLYYYVSGSNRSVSTENVFGYSNVISLSNFSSLSELYVALRLSSANLINVSTQRFFISDFITDLYVGDSWSNRSYWTENTDLNIADTPIEYVSNPPADSDTLLDIKGLIQDLIDTNDLRAPVINNFYYPDEAAVPEADLDRTTYDPTDYVGVVSVPDGVFDGLATDNHDGFIDYLWYMTKPLVQFTAGFIESVTFGPEGGFDETGPGIIVFGVISLGLAGGLVSKFLL